MCFSRSLIVSTMSVNLFAIFGGGEPRRLTRTMGDFTLGSWIVVLLMGPVVTVKRRCSKLGKSWFFWTVPKGLYTSSEDRGPAPTRYSTFRGLISCAVLRLISTSGWSVFWIEKLVVRLFRKLVSVMVLIGDFWKSLGSRGVSFSSCCKNCA